MKTIMVKGVHNSGKTTLVAEIIKELTARGYTVGSIKDIHSESFMMDHPGTDTYLHQKSGSTMVAARGLAETDLLIQKRLTASEIIAFFDQDYLVIEGDPGLQCPNLVTGHEPSDLDARMDSDTIGFGGVVGDTMTRYKDLPVFQTTGQIKEIVDYIEENAMENNKKNEERKLKLYFDDEEVQMVPFVESIIRASVLGIVGELHGYEEGTKIRIEL